MAVVRSPKDFIAGLMFIAVGIAAIVIASNYTLGTAARMGPGYFPRILGILMIVLGAVLALRSLRVPGAPLPGWKWRPVIVVLGSVVVFGLIVDARRPRAVDDPADRHGQRGESRIPAEGSGHQRHSAGDPRGRCLRDRPEAADRHLAGFALGPLRWTSSAISPWASASR